LASACAVRDSPFAPPAQVWTQVFTPAPGPVVRYLRVDELVDGLVRDALSEFALDDARYLLWRTTTLELCGDKSADVVVLEALFPSSAGTLEERSLVREPRCVPLVDGRVVALELTQHRGMGPPELPSDGSDRPLLPQAALYLFSLLC